ncbi:MAG TPA: glycoside hydrolase family 38 C-terminal domain-containing protein [Gemmataceae bacterium]|nr:glycoside hydrolase family 38 C-terminal domain-containing protein [Gemmataceae bacterium]
MNMLGTVLLGAILSVSAEQAADPSETSPQPTFWIIPHTHWEGAVFKTREQYLEMGLPHLLKALRLLKTQPNYRFVLDQVAYVKPFLERYPEEEADFRRFVAEGRLQLVLGMDIMPDVNMPGGETFIRQVQYGKGYYRKKFGVDVTAGWLIDTFGHHAQMPQLLTRSGYRSFWFSRGVPRPDFPSEFLWEGIDGTRIPAFWLPYSYGLLYRSPRDLSRFGAFMKRRFEMLTPNARGTDRVGLSGVDVSEPEEHLAPLVEAYNRQKDRPLTLRLAVPDDFERVVTQRKDWPVFQGELNPIFQGTYSSRIELKQQMRSMEQLLTTAEKLDALARWLGIPGDDQALWQAWEPVLFNLTHDLASGVMTDHVYEDTGRSYQFAERLARERIETKWAAFADRIDTRGEGIPVVVFNTLGWPRTEVADVKVGFPDPGVASAVVTDSTGQAVPVQISEAIHDGDGSLRTVRLAFLARNVPALGYHIYHVVAKQTAGPAPPKAETDDTLENEFYRLTVDPLTGAITSLMAKADNWEVVSSPANIVVRQPDHGDLWELYQGLDGGSKIAMTRKQPIPRPGQALFSSEFQAKPGTILRGPVFSEFRVAHPLGNGTFTTSVRLTAGLRRIDLRTTLVNQEKFVRYQALFPTTIRAGKSFHAIPFGAMERPAGIEFAAQDWVDYGDGRRGLALLNHGLPGNVQTDGTLMLSLLRSHTLGAYGFGGGYEPGMSSDSGLQLGKERTLQYSLVPHGGDWREAGVYRDGLEFNHPLICAKIRPHDGPLPKRWGLVEVSHPNVVISALKPGPDGTTVVRVYEATGRAATDVKLTVRAKVLSARECNLLEDLGQEMKTEANTLHFDLPAFTIKTFALKLEPASANSR